MTIQSFEYVVPGTLTEAFGYLKQPESRILAGDQAYVGMLKKGQVSPGGVVVSFKNLPELSQIITEGDTLLLGTTASYVAINHHPALDSLTALKDALATVADPHLLNHSTVGGALYHGTLFHEPVIGALIALNAELIIAGETGERNVPIDEFYKNGGPSSLASGELIRAVGVALTSNRSSAYDEVDLLSGSRPLCGVAVALSTQDGKVDSPRIVLTRGVAAPIRLERVEQALSGKALDATQIESAVEKLSEETLQLAKDLPIQENYLRHLIGVVLKRSLMKF